MPGSQAPATSSRNSNVDLDERKKFRSAITVSLVPQASSGPFVFHGDFDRNLTICKEVGFDAVELFLPDSTTVEADYAKKRLETLGLDLAAVGSGAGWVVHQLSLTAKDEGLRLRAIEFVKSLVDWAGVWSAPVIIGSMQGRVAPDEDRKEVLNRLSTSLFSISQYAGEKYGSTILYEPLNRYETNLFNRIGDAAQWLEDNELERVQILADLFHMNIEEVDIAHSIRHAATSIGHVHWADSNRLAMGLGHTRSDPIAEALHEIGYAGYLSGEVFPQPNSRLAAEQTLKSIQFNSR